MSIGILAARGRRWRVVALLLAAVSPLAASADALQPGHAGHWVAPERDGEGWVLELLDADTALLYWFTYDEAGNQRWLTAVGQRQQADGAGRLHFPDLVVTRGGRFGPAFDPADVVREAVGSARLSFDGCDRARFDFEAFGQAASLQLERLAHVMGTPCERPHGMTGRPAAAQAGLSGSWFDPARSGEGYALQWINPDQAILTWYTYDDAGRQYWMIGEGRIAADGRLVAQLHATRGARFGAAFDPDDVERFAWGEVALSLDCDGGVADYASPLAGFGAGATGLQRLTAIDRLACPWQPPALTDLYEFSLEELDSAVPALPGAVARGQGANLNDAGAVWTLAGSGATSRAVALAPGSRQWQLLGDANHAGRVWAAAQGEVLVSTLALADDGIVPVRWQEGEWRPLDPALGESARVTGVSGDGESVLILSGTPGSSEQAIHWSEAGGARVLRVPEYDTRRRVALFAGPVDGPVVGHVDPVRPPGAQVATPLVVWRSPEQLPLQPPGPPVGVGAPPAFWQLLEPGGCSADCTVVFGASARFTQPSPPALRAEAWYQREDGRSGFLGLLGDDPRTRYRVNGVSHDGSLVVGWTGLPSGFSFGAGEPAGSGEAPVQQDWTWNGFVWTQHTGMVSLRALIDQAGLALEGWRDAEVAAVSPDGLRLLLSGNRQGPGAPGVMTQGLALLTLVPRDGAPPPR